MLAAYAATTTYKAYDLNASYDDNISARYWSVTGGPENLADAIYPQLDYRPGPVSTDASGKISGVGEWRIWYGTSHAQFTTFFGTISGKLSGKIGSPATVTMTIKAEGYTVDGAGLSTPFKGSFKFSGQPGTNPAQTNQQAMVGIVSGSVSGSTPVDPKGFKIASNRAAYIDRSDFAYAGINVDVLQSSKGNMQLFSSRLQGNGSTKNDATYKATVKGVGLNKGISVSFSGSMNLRTEDVGGNPVSFLAPTTAEILKGSKWNGQAIQGAASRPVTADLIH